MTKEKIIDAVRQWVETVVIDLNLCPFANKVYLSDGVRFVLSDADSEEKLLIDLHDELASNIVRNIRNWPAHICNDSF